MKYLKRYIEFNEALSPSIFRPYVLEFNKTRYEELFQKMKYKYSGDKNAYRIYIPLYGVKQNPIKSEIESFLNSHSYVLVDYINGVCKREGAKNTSRIGQLLTRLKSTDLMNKFISDPSRKSGDLSDLCICISRHPYDIAGADTDRTWTNCMTLSTPNSERVVSLKSDLKQLLNDLSMYEMDDYLDSNDKSKVEETKSKIKELELKIKGYEEEGNNTFKLISDVKHGTLVSYLIKKDDKNIQNPIANLNIKPYQRDKETILVADTKMYGQGMSEFKETIDEWLDEVNGSISHGLYCLKDGLYIDSHSMEYKVIQKPNSIEELEKVLQDLGIEKYEVKEDMSVDIDGDVDLSDMGIKEIPFKFGQVNGSFDISVNRFEELKNMPNKVLGDFDCSNNLLKTLDGCPKYISGNLFATKNNIKNKNGISEVLGKIEIKEESITEE